MPDRPSLRAWQTDAGLITLAAVLGGLFFLGSRFTSDHRVPHPTVDLAVGLAACLALVLRRRWSVTVAVLLIPSIMISASAMGATAVAIAAVAVYRSWPVTASVFGAHALTLVLLFSLTAEDRTQLSQALVVLLALDIALIASGLLVRSQRLLVQSLRERAEQAEEGHRLRVEEARHAERERIAREMHDVLAHRLALLTLHAGALEVRRSAMPEERQAAGVVRQSAYEALEDLREVIGMLRDDAATAEGERPQPTLDRIDALVEQSRQAGMRVTFDSRDVDLGGVPTGIGRHAYRVVQEGLTNAHKHAPGSVVRIRLAETPGVVASVERGARSVPATAGDAGLAVEIVNALPAAPSATVIPGAGSGLIGLRERMQLVGGRLEHGVTPDRQFRLSAWLPWRP